MTQPPNNPTTQPPLRIAIWCAVSSKRQAQDDRISLQAQEDAGRQFAAALDAIVVRTYTVPGHSRDLIFWHQAEAAMDAYRQLRLDVEHGHFDILHAIDPDRLGRDPALSNQVVSLVEKAGGEVYFASAPHVIGSKGTGARYVFAIQSTRAGEDQRRRRQHHQTGMRNRTHARGLHPNRWPYGYTPTRNNAGRITGATLNPDQRPALQLITRLFLQGAPYAHIARALDAAGHPTPRPTTARWDHSVIRDILENPTYAGYPPWALEPAPTKSEAYPALWTARAYAAIQRELTHRRHKNGRRTTSPFIDVAHCAKCRGPMHRTSTGGPGRRRPAYQCGTHHKHHTCHPNTLSEATLIDATTQYLQRLADPETLNTALAARNTPETQLRQDLAALAARIDATNQKRQRLALALAAGDIQPAIYKITDDHIAADLTTQTQKRAQLLDALQTIPDTEAQRQTIADLLDKLPTLWTLPGHQINALLRHAGLHIEIDNRQITTIKLT